MTEFFAALDGWMEVNASGGDLLTPDEIDELHELMERYDGD